MEINYNNKLTTADLIICPNIGHVIKGVEELRISPVNLKVLILLIKNQGKVVSRNQIFNSVWTNQEVSDDTLTRCISDLRAQIGKDHIKTLPKRGYQWLPKIEQYTENSNQPKIKKITSKIMLWTIILISGFLLLSVTTLWIANQIIKPNQIRIALLPLKINSNEHAELANLIESELKDLIMQSNELKLLSSSVIGVHRDKPYPSLNQEYSIRYIIEGEITDYDNNKKITLSLVDARTALIIFSMNNENMSENQKELNMNQQFIQKIRISKN